MPKMVLSVPTAMLDFLDAESRYTGLARSEIVRGYVMHDKKYTEYLKNLTKNQPTTVVEPTTKVSPEPEPVEFVEDEWDYDNPEHKRHEAERLAAFHKSDREDLIKRGLWTGDDEAAYQRKYGKTSDDDEPDTDALAEYEKYEREE